ncbi:MAG TPA: hypothetical protein RMG48_12090 [Myxococcales bacterium LLY-WYZ-16_1]|nr:hypothetical protein [Myxococcales bacterium LLY-WYZ-16_1]
MIAPSTCSGVVLGMLAAATGEPSIRRIEVEPRPTMPALVVTPSGARFGMSSADLLRVASAAVEPVSRWAVRSPEQSGLPLDRIDACRIEDFIGCINRVVRTSEASSARLLWIWTVTGRSSDARARISLMRTGTRPRVIQSAPFDGRSRRDLEERAAEWFASQDAKELWSDLPGARPPNTLRVSGLTSDVRLRWNGRALGTAGAEAVRLTGLSPGMARFRATWPDGTRFEVQVDPARQSTLVVPSPSAGRSRPLRWVAGALLASAGLLTVVAAVDLNDGARRICPSGADGCAFPARFGATSAPDFGDGGSGPPIWPFALGSGVAGASLGTADLMAPRACRRRWGWCLAGSLVLGAGAGAAAAAASR